MKKPTQKSPSPKVFRRRLQGGPWVSSDTFDQVETWQRCGVSVGRVIDHLTRYAVANNFSPVEAEAALKQLAHVDLYSMRSNNTKTR